MLSGVSTSLFVLCRLTVEWDADHRDCADLRGGGSLFAASCDAYGPWTCKRLLTGKFSATCYTRKMTKYLFFYVTLREVRAGALSQLCPSLVSVVQ